MTDKDIQVIIDNFNVHNRNAFIASKPIGPNVHYGLVWSDKDYYGLGDISPYKFYFITDPCGLCIGAVLDMKSDLHWYINPEARKQGYLKLALLHFILPHLAIKRKQQRITINRDDIGEANFEASLRTAKLVGFKFNDENFQKIEGYQNLEKYKKLPLSEFEDGISMDRMVELRKEMSSIAVKLWSLQAEIEMNLGNSKYSRQLSRIVTELNKIKTYKLDDARWDFEENKN